MLSGDIEALVKESAEAVLHEIDAVGFHLCEVLLLTFVAESDTEEAIMKP
jgi:hypothetical protein